MDKAKYLYPMAKEFHCTKLLGSDYTDLSCQLTVTSPWLELGRDNSRLVLSTRTVFQPDRAFKLISSLSDGLGGSTGMQSKVFSNN